MSGSPLVLLAPVFVMFTSNWLLGGAALAVCDAVATMINARTESTREIENRNRTTGRSRWLLQLARCGARRVRSCVSENTYNPFLSVLAGIPWRALPAAVEPASLTSSSLGDQAQLQDIAPSDVRRPSRTIGKVPADGPETPLEPAASPAAQQNPHL